MMTIDQIKSTAPSVFTTTPSPKMSDKYVFVPTFEILENFEREGWELSSVKQTGRGIHSVHELRLRNGELPKVGDSLVEAIIRNSHNGMATFSVSAGLHRLVCSNGLTVPTSLSESFNIRHQRFELDEVKSIDKNTLKTKIKLLNNNTPNDLIKVLIEVGQLEVFKEIIPSMNDIFISAVVGKGEEIPILTE